ncbi:MAG: DUF3105 domain-containing protein [Trueperaceae bacterium]|nr:DUF3105 domain-containing protein [Trueperaceae bacterium]
MANPQKHRSKRKRAPGRARGNRLPWILGGIGVVALIAVPIALQIIQSANLPGERFASQGNRHIALGTNVPDYNSDPPTSGPHTPDLASWGTYEPGDEVNDQRLIHNMEDGGVILWYRPAEDAAATNERISVLEQASRGYRRVVIAPRPDMETPFTLTAWQRLQRFDEPDVDAMRTFVDAYEGIDHHAGF